MWVYLSGNCLKIVLNLCFSAPSGSTLRPHPLSRGVSKAEKGSCSAWVCHRHGQMWQVTGSVSLTAQVSLHFSCCTHLSQHSTAAVPAMGFRRDRQVVRASPRVFPMTFGVHETSRALSGDYLQHVFLKYNLPAEDRGPLISLYILLWTLSSR